jgi:AcrR family transcriptional regulator
MKKAKAGRIAHDESGGRARGPGEDGQATREALMGAALRLLDRDGVLAGLNVSEVAKEVGVTPANIYHYFKSRQGLLRAAINWRMAELTAASARDREELPWPVRTRRGFEFVRSAAELSLVALLALDKDEEYVLAPFLDSVRRVLDRDKRLGILVDGVDHEVMHMVFIAMQYGYAIFSAGAARQLDMPYEEFDQRAQKVFDRMVMAFCQPEPTAP